MKNKATENTQKTKETIWLIVNSDRSFICGRMFDSKAQAEYEIEWDNALRGCIAIPATLQF